LTSSGKTSSVWWMAHPFLRSAVAALMLTSCASVKQPGCADTRQGSADVERTVRALFVALGTEDKATFQRLTTPDFYSFDNGKRYLGTELVEVVSSAHRRGVQLNWSIGPINTNVRCDVAWSSWENSGSAGIPPDVKPVHWLESAVLVRADGQWKVQFFHSQRAAMQ
jgi:hypothetical protein